MRLLRRPEPWVFAILFATYAFFWQARDWNGASRLMLTYAIVDRGTISLDGLERQTGDKAYFRGHYYTDKLPGFSLLAAGPYALAKAALGLPDHPLKRDGFAYWPADYGVTLATSGLLTALTAVLLVGLACDLGCGPGRSALVGLAYGLATPAYAYATMAYGHQATAFALLASFALLWRAGPSRDSARVLASGFLASYASVVELQVGPVSAILGLYLLAQVVGRRRRPSAIGAFAVGAVVPALILLGYNQLAFGSPWDMGYFHHATGIFSRVHSSRNPLGLGSPRWDRAVALLWGGHRGLLFYAPVVVLALPGWLVLIRRRLWGVATVSAGVVLAVFLVNLSYPEWTGGFSTGPRLLVPMLPFAMLPVSAWLASGGRPALWATVALALAGGVLMLLFVGIGAGVPPGYGDPLRQAVWPHWRGDPLPPFADQWPYGRRFARNAVAWCWPTAIRRLPDRWLWVQFLPLGLAQAATIAAMGRAIGAKEIRPAC